MTALVFVVWRDYFSSPRFGSIIQSSNVVKQRGKTARAIAFLTPNVTLRNDGWLMTTALGARWIPYDTLRAVRSTELQPNGRYVVWIDSTSGLPCARIGLEPSMNRV